MTACELDGSMRVVIDRDRYGVTWKCTWCRSLAREEHEPTSANDLQREWGNR